MLCLQYLQCLNLSYLAGLIGFLPYSFHFRPITVHITKLTTM